MSGSPTTSTGTVTKPPQKRFGVYRLPNPGVTQWDEHYWDRDTSTPWNKKITNRYLRKYYSDFMDVGKASAADVRIFLPLINKCADMMWLWRRGHEVVGIEKIPGTVHDFAIETGATVDINNNEDVSTISSADYVMKVLQRQLVTLENPFIHHTFDCVWDRAGLSSIKPEDRKFYASIIRALLKRERFKYLVVCLEFRPSEEEENPTAPYPVTTSDIIDLFGDFCRIRKLDETYIQNDPNYFIPARFRDVNVKEVVYMLESKCSSDYHLAVPPEDEEY